MEHLDKVDLCVGIFAPEIMVCSAWLRWRTTKCFGKDIARLEDASNQETSTRRSNKTFISPASVGSFGRDQMGQLRELDDGNSISVLVM